MPGKDAPRARLTAYLGTIPDYVAGDVKGLKLSGVSKEAPAAKAGVRGGDIIVQLAGRKIEDIYDYTYAIEALKIGEEVTIVVQRGEKTVTWGAPEARKCSDGILELSYQRFGQSDVELKMGAKVANMSWVPLSKWLDRSSMRED